MLQITRTKLAPFVNNPPTPQQSLRNKDYKKDYNIPEKEIKPNFKKISYQNRPTNFKILFQNFQSINNKQHLLEALIDEDSSYRAICVSESWLTEAKLELLQISGYRIASHFTRKNRVGGGVCILLQDDVEYEDVTSITDTSIEYNLELCAVKLTRQNVLLICAYWNGDDRDRFNSQLNILLNLLQKKYPKTDIVIGGDFNINILEINNKPNRFIRTMSEHNFTQYINSPTHFTKTSSSCIDLVFTNSNKYQESSVKNLGFTNHMAIELILKIPPPLSPQTDFWHTHKRMYSKRNMDLFKNSLIDIDWEKILIRESNVNDNYNMFHSILTDILNKFIPIQKIKLQFKKKKLWLTTGIKKSCHNKRLLKFHALQSNSELLYHHYKTYEKMLKKTVNTSKKLQYISQMKTSNNKIKTMWKIINERTNKNKLKLKENIKLNINAFEQSDPNIISKHFNNHFASIGQIKHANAKGRPVILPTTNTMYLHFVTYREVSKIIRNLKNKKSCGFDDFPPILFKHCADLLTIPLCLLINQSFEQGVFPSLLKKAVITPVHKRKSKTNTDNYRPIAVLPTSAKIFEKAIHDRIYSFCEKFNVFHHSQNGFRKNHSTTLAVFKFTQEILNILKNKHYAVGILIDMTKAYDKVQFNILLNKLNGVGIRGKAHDWLTSYLHNREQYVQIEYYNQTTREIVYHKSDCITTHASIPQGSVIGCLLFLIYINDLPKILNDPCILFADDISLVSSHKNNDNINEKLTKCLDTITDWMTDHNLEINPQKTKLITFYPHQKPPLDINFSYNNIPLEIIKEASLLGIIIDSHLNWKSHVQKLKGKISKFSYALREVKKSTNTATALSAYYAHAHSLLNYGIILWGNSTDAPQLFRLQKKLLRIIANIEPTHTCKPHFKTYSILTLPSIYLFEIIKLVRKYPETYKTRDTLNNLYSFRHKHKILLPKINMSLQSTNTYIMSITIYNKLPDSYKNISNEIEFLKKVKNHLLQKAYYSIEEYLNETHFL